MRIVNVNELGHGLEIAETGQYAELGEEIEVESADLGTSLIESGLWARPSTKAAKAAAKEGN